MRASRPWRPMPACRLSWAGRRAPGTISSVTNTASSPSLSGSTSGREAAHQPVGPTAGPVGLAGEEVIVLVDEEALGLGHLTEPMVTEPSADSLRGASGEFGRPVETGVEGRRRGAVHLAEAMEPGTQARPLCIGVECAVVVLGGLGQVHGTP